MLCCPRARMRHHRRSSSALSSTTADGLLRGAGGACGCLSPRIQSGLLRLAPALRSSCSLGSSLRAQSTLLRAGGGAGSAAAGSPSGSLSPAAPAASPARSCVGAGVSAAGSVTLAVNLERTATAVAAAAATSTAPSGTAALRPLPRPKRGRAACETAPADSLRGAESSTDGAARAPHPSSLSSSANVSTASTSGARSVARAAGVGDAAVLRGGGAPGSHAAPSLDGNATPASEVIARRSRRSRSVTCSSSGSRLKLCRQRATSCQLWRHERVSVYACAPQGQLLRQQALCNLLSGACCERVAGVRDGAVSARWVHRQSDRLMRAWHPSRARLRPQITCAGV